MAADCETPLVLRVMRARGGSRMRVRSCQRRGVGCAHNRAVFGEALCNSLPGIGIKAPVVQMLSLVIQALARCSLTPPAYPGKRAPCAMLHGFDDPELLVVVKEKRTLS